MIDGKNFYDQPVKKHYENIQKIETGQGYRYITGCLLRYLQFKECYEMIAANLSKQQAIDVNPKAIQEIGILEMQNKQEIQQMIFFTEVAKQTVLDFSQVTVRVFYIYFPLTQYQYKMTQQNNVNVKVFTI